ncbi:MAG: aldo/keto reductase [Clostridia bacterium]|nr:aldo/keto reductase [Clostridia bacterium]
MRYRKLFEELPPLSAAALGTDYYGKTIPEPEARALLEAYLEAGGNVIDTAHVYSDYLPGAKHMSEKVIGRWLWDNGARERVVLCTKGGFPVVGDMHASRIDRDSIRADMYESLGCLGVDNVDIYWLHRDDPNVPVSEIAGWMDELYREGVFRYWGVSNWNSRRIGELRTYCADNGLTPPACSQIKWSFAVPNPGSAGDDTLQEMDRTEHAWYLKNPMPVFAYSSQAKGFFSKLGAARAADGGKTRVIDGIADPGGKAGKRYFSARNVARYRTLEALSAETGIDPGQLAIWWMTRPGTIPAVPVVGPRNIDQLRDTLAGVNAEIDPETLKKYVLFRRDRL